MTKKDYIAIAKVIDEQTVFGSSYVDKGDLVLALGNAFQADNHRFAVWKFTEACYKTLHTFQDVER